MRLWSNFVLCLVGSKINPLLHVRSSQTCSNACRMGSCPECQTTKKNSACPLYLIEDEHIPGSSQQLRDPASRDFSFHPIFEHNHGYRKAACA